MLLQSEGRFFRLETLDVGEICGGPSRVKISEEYIPLDKPEIAGDIKRVAVSGKTSMMGSSKYAFCFLQSATH